MKKIIIDKEELGKWIETTWSLYASNMYQFKLLRMWVNCEGFYKVSYEQDILYEGPEMDKAIEAWEAI